MTGTTWLVQNLVPALVWDVLGHMACTRGHHSCWTVSTCSGVTYTAIQTTCFQGRPLLFQQDNAKLHSIITHIIPARLAICTPDLSPIEYIWCIKKQNIWQRRQLKSVKNGTFQFQNSSNFFFLFPNVYMFLALHLKWACIFWMKENYVGFTNWYVNFVLASIKYRF